MKDVKILEKKKQSLISRLFGIRSAAEKEEIARTHREEIEQLEAQVKSVSDEIYNAMVDGVKEKVGEISTEATKLVVEEEGLLKRMDEIEKRKRELFNLASETIPKKRVQRASDRTVKMFREVEYAEFMGMFKSSDLVYEGGVPVAHKLAASYNLHKKVLELEVPAFESQVRHAESLGWHLKEGEKIEPEELTDQNSVWIPVVAMPEALQ